MTWRRVEIGVCGVGDIIFGVAPTYEGPQSESGTTNLMWWCAIHLMSEPDVARGW